MKNGADLLAFGDRNSGGGDRPVRWMGNEPTAATALLPNMAAREIKIADKKK